MLVTDHLSLVKTRQLIVYALAQQSHEMIDENESKFVDLTKYNSVLRYFSFGTQFHGFRYSVLINKHALRNEYVDINALNLLSLFGRVGCLLLLVTTLHLGCTLKTSGIKTYLIYYLFTTLLEQGDDKQEFVNKQTFI